MMDMLTKILDSQEREEEDTKRTRSDIVDVKGQVSALATKVDGITRDLGGEGGEPRMRERVVKIEGRLDGHDEDIEDIREQGKTEKANRWALWLTVLGAILLTAVTAIVKYLAQ